MDRTAARTCAMKLVYEWEMGGDGGEETRLNMLEVKSGEEEADYMNALFDNVVEKRAGIDALISEYARGWNIDRISRVDLAILRVGVCELMSGSVPAPVVINEAVELARGYSEDKAGPFINGVLGAIARSGKLSGGVENGSSD